MMKHDNLLFKSKKELGNALKNEEITATEIVKMLLERIKTFDCDLNSFITINPKALELAKEVDQEISLGSYRGPLHGIPIGLKDMINTSDLKTTMGSPIYKDYVPREDATVVRQLKQAGAIIIGKLNTHQFAYGPTGDRSYYGPVRNPYNLSRMAGGSSSGSAAAVAAYLTYGALGTDTSGSVRIPASFCGIVGMKPTKGLISEKGIYPLSWTLDDVGPMTRTVQDNALLMNTLQHCNENESTIQRKEKEDYTRGIGQHIHNLTVGIPKQFYLDNLHEEIKEVFHQVISNLEALGVKITRVYIPNMEAFSEAQKLIIRTESYVIHEKNLNKYPELWDTEVKERLENALEDKGFEYAKALQMRNQAKKEFNQALDHIDALITPTLSITPPKVNERYIGENKSDENHIRWSIIRLTGPTNLNGFPSLSIPGGFTKDGLPVGIQLIGKEFTEAKLYQIGYALEQKLSFETMKMEIGRGIKYFK